MKKEYEKPVVEVIMFEYDVQADGDSTEGTVGVGGWWA